MSTNHNCGKQAPPPKPPVMDVWSPTLTNALLAKGMSNTGTPDDSWNNLSNYIETLKQGIPAAAKRRRPECDLIEKNKQEILVADDPYNNAYTLSETPKDGSLIVYIDGIFQNESFYSITNKSLTFPFSVDSNSNVTVSYQYDELDPYCDPYEDPYFTEDDPKFSLRDAIFAICGDAVPETYFDQTTNPFPDGLPGLSFEQRSQIWQKRNEICNNIWHGNGTPDLPGLTQAQKEQAAALYELEMGFEADLEFEASLAFEAVAAFAFSAELSISVSLAASVTLVLPTICFAIALSASVTLELPGLALYLQIVAIISAGITALVLFKSLVAGIDIDVTLGLKPLVLLLWSLVYPNLGAGVEVDIEIPIIPVFGVGSGLSVGISGIRAGINLSAMASIGMSGSLGLSASATASASASAGAAAAFSATGSVPPGPAISASTSVSASAVSGFEMAPGSAVNPNSGAIDSLRQNQRAALCEGVKFGSSSRPPTPEELKARTIDTETKINIVPANGRTSVIKHSNLIKLTDAVIPKTGMNGIRDAINRAKCDESSIIYLFDKLGLKYDAKITTSELILRAIGWDQTMPIDPMVLNLIQQNMPTGIRFNSAFVMITLGGTESPGLIIMPG